MNIASFAPLAVVLPILGAALTFLLIRHPRAQRAVSIALLTLTLLLECWLLASVWDGGTAAVNLGGWLPPWGIVHGGGPVLLADARGVLGREPCGADLRHRDRAWPTATGTRRSRSSTRPT